MTAVVAWLRSHQGPSLEAAAHHAERQGLDGCVLTELLQGASYSNATVRAALGLTDDLQLAKLRGGLRKLQLKRDLCCDDHASPAQGERRTLKRPRLVAERSPAATTIGCDRATASTTVKVTRSTHADPAAVVKEAQVTLVSDVRESAHGGPLNIVYVVQPPQTLECAICAAAVMHEPHIITGVCAHSFCRKCLLQCLQQKRECPKCKKPATEHAGADTPVDELIIPSTDVYGIASEQQIYCPHGVRKLRDGSDGWRVDPRGCGSILPLQQLDMHLAVCDHAPVACELLGCEWAGKRCELAAHQKECVLAKLQPTLGPIQGEIATMRAELAETKQIEATLGRMQKAIDTVVSELAATKRPGAGMVYQLHWDINDAAKFLAALKRLDAHLVKNDAARCAALGEAGVVQAVVDGMRKHITNERIQSLSCRVVASLMYDENVVANAAASGGMDATLGAMASFLDSENAQRYGCRALGNMICGSEAMSQAVPSPAILYGIFICRLCM